MSCFFLRKCNSAISRIANAFLTLKIYISVAGNSSINIGKFCQFGASVKLKVTDGGEFLIGQHICIGDHVQIIVQGGTLTIENNVFIGTGSVIVCREEISIGRDSLIAEYVVIRDQDHRTDTRPLGRSGFITNPIHIGRDVWIGCKATILRGAFLGDRCVIGAHALVKSHIPDDMLAVGAPARVVKRLESGQ